MKKLKYYFSFATKALGRYKKIFFLVLCLIAITAAMVRFWKENLHYQQVSQGIVGTHTEDDLPLLITRLLSESLINIDETGNPRPNLVTGWEVSEDAKTFTFKLKPDLTWIDGRPLNSSDISLVFPDVTVETPDDLTIIFKLADSYSPFPTLLNKPILRKEDRVGIGPYQITTNFKDIIFLKKVILTPNTQSLPQITMRFYPNEKIAKSALKLGEVQSLIGVNDLSEVSTEPPFAVYKKTNYNRLVTIFYNTQDPILSDENFRLALSYAAPTIANTTEATSSISPKSWAFNKDVKDYLNNPEAAKTALGKVQKGKDETITLTVTAALKSVGEQVVNTWNQQGIKAVLRPESGLPQDFQALLITQNIPPDPDQYSLWHKLGATNISKFSSQRTDKDLEDARKLVDINKRKDKYYDFQKILLDNSPATFLYFPEYNVVYLKKIEQPLMQILDRQLKNL